MRYVNLKKRNTSKFQFMVKRLASFSMLALFIAAVVIVPLTARANYVQAQENQNNVIEIDNEYLNDNNVEAMNK